jgi:hypothetical protein
VEEIVDVLMEVLPLIAIETARRFVEDPQAATTTTTAHPAR